mgnify:CR=1 FL=1
MPHSGELGRKLRISLVVDNTYDVRSLNGVHRDTRRTLNVSLMLGRAHAAVDMETFRTHPAADQHDHRVVNMSGVQGGRQTTTE